MSARDSKVPLRPVAHEMAEVLARHSGSWQGTVGCTAASRAREAMA
jgi:hypothetical protein